MRLFTLDKRLQIVNHKMTKQEIVSIADSHKMEVQEIEREIKRQMLVKFLPAIEKQFEVIRSADEDSVTYSVRGYILTERQMYEVILEVLDLDDTKAKEVLRKSIHNSLGIFSQL